MIFFKPNLTSHFTVSFGKVIAFSIILTSMFSWYGASFVKQQINDRTQISQLESQNKSLSAQVQKLTEENKQLSFVQQEVVFEGQETFSRGQSAISQAELISEENEKLKTLMNQISGQQNSLVKTVTQTMQNGLARPSKVGYAPIFKFTLDKIDQKAQFDTFKRLGKGSFCKKQEIVNYNWDNVKSWKSAGSWRMTGYTATTAECDSNPSETATGHLVTPGFTLAIDHDYWPYGTIFFIEGVGFAIADDCGGAIKGQKRGDFLTSDNNLSEYINDRKYLNVWVVYKPTK